VYQEGYTGVPPEGPRPSAVLCVVSVMARCLHQPREAPDAAARARRDDPGRGGGGVGGWWQARHSSQPGQGVAAVSRGAYCNSSGGGSACCLCATMSLSPVWQSSLTVLATRTPLVLQPRSLGIYAKVVVVEHRRFWQEHMPCWAAC